VNAKQGFVRKKFFIDREIQGRYMLTLLVPMLVLLLFFMATLFFASQNIVNTTVGIIKEDLESKTEFTFQDQVNPAVETYMKNVKNYLREFSGDKRHQRAVLEKLLLIFGIGILLIVAQLAWLTVFFSHKLAGPIYRFEKACKSIVDGNYTQQIFLRKGDEMQNLARLLNDVMRVSGERMAALGEAASEEERKKILSGLKI
jgi:nitrogen fixation/metabolism regulation signal transduction histidine kinase